MKPVNPFTLSTSPPFRPAGKPRLTPRFLYGRTRRNFTGKGRDAETGLYYYGARYLDPRAARWGGGDPALGEYIPAAGRGSGGLPGMGGVFNTVNLHAYHYAGNNPVKYIDPDGRETITVTTTKEQFDEMNWDPIIGEAYPWVNSKWNEMQTFFQENPNGAYYRAPGEMHWQQFEDKNDIKIIDPNSIMFDVIYPIGLGMLIKTGITISLEKLFVREISGHGVQRIAGEFATRGGVLASKEIDNVIAKGTRFFATKNNTNIFVLEHANGKFDIVVTGTKGLVTTFKNISAKSYAGLVNRYGWGPK